MISRLLHQRILSRLNKGKAIIVLGARQVGKTTLVKSLEKELEQDALWLIGDEPDVHALLHNATSARLKALIGKKKLLIIDEAQNVENIGRTLKLMVDQVQDVQVIATGSSALELADKLNEPLTGRKFEFMLYPLSTAELAQHFGQLEETRMLEHRLCYGMYPEVINNPGEEKEVLSQLASSYLYKDLLKLEQLKKPALLEKLLTALAHQIGNQVSFHEIAQLIGADNQTVERYVDLLEKAFVIFRLPALSRNLRNEIKKSRKIYFCDVGVRNAVIRNFAPIPLRQDVGALWENFVISERLKLNHYTGRWANSWFWRTHSQQEIDYVEEEDGLMSAYEFKWQVSKTIKFPQKFVQAYPDSKTYIVTRKNYLDFLGSGIEQ